MLASLRHRLPRLGRVPRLCAAAVCALLALTSTLGTRGGAQPAGPPVAVVAAARVLPAGHTLTRRDLLVVQWPRPLRPAGTQHDPSAFVGRRLAGPIDAREPITAVRLLGHDLASGLAGDLVAASVPLDDPHAADLVHAGDRADLLETPRPPDFGAGPPSRDVPVDTVAQRAQVLAVLPDAENAAVEVVLAVERATAVRIARDRPGQIFTLLVDPP